MRTLLINPEFPNSYWSGRASLPFARRKSLLPPLGLVTVAALLPDDWECRLVDLNVEPLDDEALRWADVAMITGMLVQRESLHEVLRRCREAGVPSVVGGPYASALPGELSDADHVVVGEGEEIIPVLAADLAAGRAKPRYTELEKPDVTRSPIPRFDLLKKGVYQQMSIQYSRGCPFSCEFCDIIVLYGRRPRTKTSEQVLAELQALRDVGYRGDIFFVDDNFIGNKPAVKKMLPEVARWRDETRAPFEFFTEASINLADDEPLIDLMTKAGFTAVFVGIETPSPEALRETSKTQNLRGDLREQVSFLKRKGLDIWAGFILGFDEDGADAFDNMIRFIEETAIPFAMVGILGALPNTPLYKRLEKEGRLREEQPGHQFGLTNVITRLPALDLVRGYRRVLETVYDPENFLQRTRRNLDEWREAPGANRPTSLTDIVRGVRAIVGQGLRSFYRKAYWSYLWWLVRHHPLRLARGIHRAAPGHHFISYTLHEVLPALLAQEADLEREASARPAEPAEPVPQGVAVEAGLRIAGSPSLAWRAIHLDRH